MRPRRAFALALGGLAAGAACKFFDVPPPPTADAGAASPEAGPAIPGLLSLDDAVRVCTQVLACPSTLAFSIQGSYALSMDPTNFAACVDTLAGPIDPARLDAHTVTALQCIASAKSCDAAAICNFYQIDAPPSADCAGMAVGGIYCIRDGGALVACESTADSTTVDCTNPNFWPPGAYCHPFGFGRALCAPDTPCPSSTTCTGGVVDECVDGGIHHVLDCALSGEPCVEDVGCTATATCNSPSDTTCDGSAEEVCALGTMTTLECATVGGRCIKSNTTTACARDGDTCSVFDDPHAERCTDATHISLCVGGHDITYDCSAVGLRCAHAAAVSSSACAAP
jgi:hypothetical protein